MAYGHSVCALAARAGLEPAAAGECHPQALTAELPRRVSRECLHGGDLLLDPLQSRSEIIRNKE